MPAKNYTKIVEDKVEEYKRIYNVTDNPNDLESLKAMVSLGLALEKMQKALLATDAEKFPKKIKDLQSAIRDSTNSFNQYQTELGISRVKRQEEEDKTTVVDYLDKLKKEAKNILDRRLKVLTCDKCGQVLGKYYIYITSEGAEEGSIAAQTKPPVPYPFTIRCGCWKCELAVKNKEPNAQSHVAEVSNEVHPII